MATGSTSGITSNAINSKNMLRLSGLASGMDTESMVAQLMKAQRAKYDKLAQQKQLMDWKTEANTSVNSLIKDFRDTYLSVLNTSTSMVSQGSLLANKVTQDASTAVSITANADASADTHVINSITSLASAAHASNASALGAGTISPYTKLSDLALTNALTFDSDNQMSFSVNGQTFTFKSTDALQDVINAVNANTKANARMTYSSLTGKLTLASKATGAASQLSVVNISGNAFADTNAAFGIAQGTYTNGTDAKVNIDGVDVTRSANTFTIDGVVYNLKNTTSTAVNFSVDQDIDATVTKVKKFVDSYNTLIGKLQDKLDEKYDSSYQPLTDDQRSSMSETQITKWETQAKTGLLQNDSYISKLVSDLRKTFYDKVASAGISASSIGLSTISYQTKGEIIVDESKLRSALANNPQQVSQTLSALSNSTNASTKYSESGLAQRMQTVVNSYLSSYNGYRTQQATKAESNLTDRMKAESDELTTKENRYWTQFSRMEEALSKMNSQSSWLSQQFSSSSK